MMGKELTPANNRCGRTARGNVPSTRKDANETTPITIDMGRPMASPTSSPITKTDVMSIKPPSGQAPLSARCSPSKDP